MQEIIDLALTLELIDTIQATKLSAIVQFVKDKDVELARLQTLVDADIKEDAAISKAVIEIVG